MFVSMATRSISFGPGFEFGDVPLQGVHRALLGVNGGLEGIELHYIEILPVSQVVKFLVDDFHIEIIQPVLSVVPPGFGLGEILPGGGKPVCMVFVEVSQRLPEPGR